MPSPAIVRRPSHGGPGTPFAVLDAAGGPHPSAAVLGRSSYYVANVGHSEPWAGQFESWEGLANRPLYRNSWLTLSRISDGLSKTVFLGEHSQRVSQKAWAGTLPGAASHPSAAFAILAGSEPDGAATLLLVHSGPADGEADVIHPPKIEFGNRRYSAALRTAVNTRNEARLARAEELVACDRAAGIIGDEEEA